MSIHQLKDGRWIVIYRSGSKHKKEYFGRGIDAQKKALERNEELHLNQYQKGGIPKALTPTFVDLANAYTQSRSSHMQPVSLKNLMYKLHSVIIPAIGHLKAMSITPAIMDRYVRNRLSLGRKRTTVHRELSDIMAVMSWATKRRLIDHNPLSGYEKPPRDDEILAPPSVEEIRAILKFSPDHLVRALTICYYTGLRPGRSELLGLTWDDVDFEKDQILIRSAKKGGLRFRAVPLADRFRENLLAWREADKGLGCVVKEIIRYKGQPVASLKHSFTTAKRKAGITRRLPMYAFRHAFATALLESGADLKATSELMGHTRPDTTMRIYQHTKAGLYKKAISGITALDDQ